MRILIAFALSLGLSACASPSTPLEAARSTAGGLSAVATLATVGTCEYRIAAEQTALAVSLRRAARVTTSGAIPAAVGRQAYDLGGQARAELREACTKGKTEADERRHAAAARDLRARIDKLIGG